MKKKRLGDVLVERGTIGQADIDQALVAQQEKNTRLGEVLIQTLQVSKREIGAAIEQVQGVPYLECPPEHISPNILALLPRAIALKCCALPIETVNNALVVAIAEPQDFKILEELRFSAGKQISPRFSFRNDILDGIRKFYDHEDLIPKELVIKDVSLVANTDLLSANAEEEDTLTELEIVVANAREENKEVLKELRAGAKKRSFAVRLTSLALARAAQLEATDLHIEPQVDCTVVRMRVDGMFRELMKVPALQQSAVTLCIKSLADLNATEQLPQDGRFLIIYKGRRLDVRVSTMPTYFGERIVMRILDPKRTLMTLDQLGMTREHQESLKGVLKLPQGMLIISGPRAAGKSTTLCSAVNFVASPERSIVSIEDAVEYILPGVTQVQASPRAGWTIAGCLPLILRQNPNVIMIGETHDRETAESALRAAKTGHLVLTTLNSDDSVDAIMRLSDLNVPSYLISSLNAVSGQRLLRMLCACRKKLQPTETFLQNLQMSGVEQMPAAMYEPAGCSLCRNTGYKGRIGVHELLIVEGAVRDAICNQASADEIRGVLSTNGFRSMHDDAIDKVVLGYTTLDEVQRIVPKRTRTHYEDFQYSRN